MNPIVMNQNHPNAKDLTFHCLSLNPEFPGSNYSHYSHNYYYYYYYFS